MRMFSFAITADLADAALAFRMGAKSNGAIQEGLAADGSQYDVSIVALLIVATALVIYFQQHSVEARILTMKSLSSTLLIFLSRLYYINMKESIADAAGLKVGHTNRIILSMSLFLFMMILFQVRLYFHKWGMWLPGGFFALVGILSHVLGFAAISGVKELQIYKQPFNTNAAMSALTGFLLAVILVAITTLSRALRKRVAEADGVVTEEEQLWMHGVAEAENEVLYLSVSFAFVQAVLHAIRGIPQVTHPATPPESIGHPEANILLLCSVGFGLASVFAVWFSTSMRLEEGSLKHVLFNALPVLMATMLAWSLVYLGDWQLYAFGFQGDRLAALLLQASFWTVVGLLLIFVMVHVSKEQGRAVAVRATLLSLGVLVGLSWGRSFDVWFDDFNQGASEEVAGLVNVVLMVGLMLVWSLLVFPAAQEKAIEATQD